jgi:integrase
MHWPFYITKVLEQPLGDPGEFNRAKTPATLPVVLTRHEMTQILSRMTGSSQLMASLLYGSGLRRNEAVRLRVKDIDFDHHQLQVWNGKGNYHRLTTLAPELVPRLTSQIQQVRLFLQEDSQLPQFAGVWMPDVLARKYSLASRTLGWQYLFPSPRLAVDPDGGQLRRHRYRRGQYKQGVKASREIGRNRETGDESLAAAFLRHPPVGSGADIRTAQEQLGHQDVKTTDINPHVLKRGARGVRRPFSDME